MAIKKTPPLKAFGNPLTKTQAALLRRFRKLKLAAERAEEAANALKPDVVDILKLLPQTQAVVTGDRLSLAEANVYDYPKAINEAQAALDSARKDARIDGTATLRKQSFRVVFTKSKASVMIE